jgi:DNA-binding SARP family transcriptional activator
LATPRIYLTGLSIEHGAHLVDERYLPGRQGRLAFVFLVVERYRPISRDELVSVIWPDTQPPAVDAALSAVLSKLRGALKKAGLSSGDAGIDVRLGSITLRVPDHTWVDIEAVQNAIDEAEGALKTTYLRNGRAERPTSQVDI